MPSSPYVVLRALVLSGAVVCVACDDPPPMTGPSQMAPPVTVSGPAVVEVGQAVTYRLLAQGTTESFSNNVIWGSSDSTVLHVATNEQPGAATALKVGNVTVTGYYGNQSASMAVAVVAGSPNTLVPPPTSPTPAGPDTTTVNGTYNATLSPVSNTCPRGFHRVLAGTLTIGGVDEDGQNGRAEYTDFRYDDLDVNVTAARTLQMLITGSPAIDGYRYDLTLTQNAAGGTAYSGVENITGPDGCRAQYTWRASR